MVNTFIPRFYRKTLGAAVGAVVAGLALTGGQAKALTVSVGGFDYDVTTFTGTYKDNVSKFETPANGGVMPWWGDSGLASSFASAVWDSLGLIPNNGYQPVAAAPLFAYQWVAGGTRYLIFDDRIQFEYVYIDGLNALHTGQSESNVNDSQTWAQVTLVSTTTGGSSANVPGPLPILGLAAAFGFSRKLRKHIKAANPTQPY